MVNIRGYLTIKNISGVVRNFAIGLSVKKQGTTNWIDCPWKRIGNLSVNKSSTYDLTVDINLPAGTYDAKFGIWEGWSGGSTIQGDYYTGGTLVSRLIDHDLMSVFTITEAPLPPIICNYTDENGIVTEALAVKAHNDWQNGIIPMDMVVDIILYWNDQIPILECIGSPP